MLYNYRIWQGIRSRQEELVFKECSTERVRKKSSWSNTLALTFFKVIHTSFTHKKLSNYFFDCNFDLL